MNRILCIPLERLGKFGALISNAEDLEDPLRDIQPSDLFLYCSYIINSIISATQLSTCLPMVQLDSFYY